MRSLFSFEFNIAFKDRPQVFQVITMVVLAFSISVILVNTLARFSTPATAAGKAYRYEPVDKYPEFVASPLTQEVYQKK